MTKVTFFEDFYCFEYHSRHEAPQRFHYFLYSPVYSFSPALCTSTTQSEYDRVPGSHSGEFIPGRLTREYELWLEAENP